MAEKNINLGNSSTTVNVEATGKVVGSNIKSKGSKLHPVYFDENGIAVETPGNIINYVTGTGTAAKTSSPYNFAKWEATIDSVNALVDGLTIYYKVPVAGNGSYGTCLQINSFGYHPVVRGLNGGISTRYSVGAVILLCYCSTLSGTVYNNSASSSTISGCWVCVNDTDNNDNTLAYQVRDNGLKPRVASALYRYKFCGMSIDNKVVPLTTTNQSTSTIVAKQTNSIPFRGSLGLYYYNSTTTISAEGYVGNQTLYTAFNASAVYTFNSSIASYRIVYLKGTYNTKTDMFTLPDADDDSWYTVVPNNSSTALNYNDYFTKDSYYMLVGVTYSTADQLSLFQNNPIYLYNGTDLVPVSNIGSEPRVDYEDISESVEYPDKNVLYQEDEYQDLNTSNKKILGSINEIVANIGNIESDISDDNYSTEIPGGTIDDLAAYTSGKPGMTGSIHLTKKSSGIGSEITAGWYSYTFMPHRTGIGGDNARYGTVILIPMNFTGSSWILYRNNNTTSITSVEKIVTSNSYSFNSSTKTLTITV